MMSGSWRCLDASWVRRNRFPGGEISSAKADFTPDVAFEIPSPGATPSQIQRKRQDYHESDVIQVWIDPDKKVAELVQPDKPLEFFQPGKPLTIGKVPDFHLEVGDLCAI